MNPSIQELLMVMISDIDRIRRTDPQAYQTFLDTCRASYEAKMAKWHQDNPGDFEEASSKELAKKYGFKPEDLKEEKK